MLYFRYLTFIKFKNTKYGIIMLPFLFGAFVIGVFSIIKTIKLLISKQIGFKEILFGLTTSQLYFLD